MSPRPSQARPSAVKARAKKAAAGDRQDEPALRRSIVEACRAMNALGINQGTSGNISVRFGSGLLITPTGIAYDELAPEMIAAMPLAGPDDPAYGSWTGPKRPSSEWRFHLDIARTRPEVQAIVHTHSTYATTLAICGRGIPACHYMVAAAGGPDIRLASYATYGTAELSAHVLEALAGRRCCLLANHGAIATGPSLKRALWLAVELETIAKQYYLSLVLGGPNILPEEEIERVRQKMSAGYGAAAEVVRSK
jgi:L-fuculose-phosphate aldolase